MRRRDLSTLEFMMRRISPFVLGGLSFCLALLVSTSVQAQRPLGCDMSSYQPSVNWAQLTNAGVKFAWTKATEGTYYIDAYIATHESGAKGAGVYMGLYHYAKPSDDPNITGASSADTEATYFWNVASNYVKSGGTYLVPALDWEDTGETTGLSAATLSAWVNEWCLSVSNKAAAAGVFGVRPVVYTGTWYSEPSSSHSGLTTAVTNWANWMSDYSGESAQTGSPTTYPWVSWNIWQYDDTNTAVANWTGGDVDVFNGTLAGFIKTFVIGSNNAPVFTSSPTNITVGVGSNVTFAVQASGPAPLGFQWRFGGKVIPGATSSNYTITSVQMTNAGGYTVTVSNSYASVPSSAAFLSVLGPQTNATGSVLAPAGMVNWWPAQGNAHDIYGANNATPCNGMSYTNGEVGLAFHFDGSTSYLTPGTTNYIAPAWTVCLWVNRQNAPGASAALMGDGTNVLKLEQYSGTREVGISESGVADYVFSPAYTVPAGVWTHLAFVGTSTAVTLYTNGVSEGSVSVSSFPLSRACIGADLIAGNPTDFMLGSLDEIQTFNVALSAAEISDVYNAGSAGLVCAPEFTGTVSTNSGHLQLQMQGLTGKNFTLRGSPNLVNWVTLGTIPNPTGATNYTGSTTANTQQFYRLEQ
jgi:GH25 family lysozyme M1 (1,4-beta-N-acetylmuramidase)